MAIPTEQLDRGQYAQLYAEAERLAAPYGENVRLVITRDGSYHGEHNVSAMRDPDSGDIIIAFSDTIFRGITAADGTIIRQALSRDEQTAIIGHEMGHAILGHEGMDVLRDMAFTEWVQHRWPPDGSEFSAFKDQAAQGDLEAQRFVQAMYVDAEGYVVARSNNLSQIQEDAADQWFLDNSTYDPEYLISALGKIDTSEYEPDLHLRGIHRSHPQNEDRFRLLRGERGPLQDGDIIITHAGHVIMPDELPAPLEEVTREPTQRIERGGQLPNLILDGKYPDKTIVDSLKDLIGFGDQAPAPTMRGEPTSRAEWNQQVEHGHPGIDCADVPEDAHETTRPTDGNNREGGAPIRYER